MQAGVPLQIGDSSFVLVSDPLHEVLDVPHRRELLLDLREQATVRIELLGMPVNHQHNASQVALDDAHLRLEDVQLAAVCLQSLAHLANLATQVVAKLTHFSAQTVDGTSELAPQFANLPAQLANPPAQLAHINPQEPDLRRQAINASLQVVHPGITIVHRATPDGLQARLVPVRLCGRPSGTARSVASAAYA